ncbi:MAG: AAA family ATPase, partial [Alphaproteobacteria bacterium]|nr:AAA family ATPase [Alphaproteobacteria bacterium]
MLRFFAKHSTAFPFLSFDFSSVDEMEGHKKVTHARGLRRAIMRARLDPVTLELDRRIDWVSRACSLSPIETAILSVCVRVKLYSGWQQFQRAVEEDHTSSTRSSFIELVTGFPDSSVREALRSGSKLLRTGLIEEHCDGQFAASEVVCRIARSAGEMAQHWEEELLSRAPPSSLAWEDFTHIQGRDLAEALVRGALDTGAGANLLLYGIPGTGKSEFARALADRLEMTAHFVGETDDEGGEPTRRERLAHFSLVRALVPPGARRLIVVDEAEDVMLPPSGDERVNASKLWLNQLIESTRTPIIWIVNDIDKLTAPVIRRMSLALRFDLPPRAVRERVASRHAQTLGLDLETKEQQQLAAMPVSPAVAATALTVAKRTDGSIATAIAAAYSVQRALGDRQPLSRIDDAVFDPALSVADIDLTLLTRKIASLDDQRWSMLLSGPSGTGKSAYARHVATACGLELLEKRASDLLSMFVGGTEAAIAAMFEQAVDANAVLIIDEADSFLRDRRTASAWWDVSMVNELLSWMEAHPLPVIASTNFADM